MIYISKGHSEGRLRHGEPTERVVRLAKRPLMKSISMVLLDRETYTTEKLLDVVWKHAGDLCVKVVFNHDYVDAEGKLSHTYDLYFQWGRFGEFDVTNKYVNVIMRDIERDLEATGEFDMRGRSHGVTP